VAASLNGGGGGVSTTAAQPYVQVGAPVVIPDLPGNTIYEYGGLGAFDAAITTFVFGVAKADGVAELQVFANSADAGSPPAFALAATVPIAGTSTVVGVYATLSDNGLVCAAACFDNNINVHAPHRHEPGVDTSRDREWHCPRRLGRGHQHVGRRFRHRRGETGTESVCRQRFGLQF